VPVLIIPFVVIFKHERVSPRAILGAIVAVAGVAMLLRVG
jgi:drug/metabolite transporter (DMT)-like permease